MFDGIIFRTINLTNGKWFIGLDQHNAPKSLGDNVLLRRDIKKYGRKKFRKEILCKAESIDQLYLLEQKMLEDYDAYRNPASYNVSLVGDNELAIAGFSKLAQAEQTVKRAGQWDKLSSKSQTKIKNAVAKAHRGKAKTDSHKAKISKSLKGRANPKTADALKQFWESAQGDQMRNHLQSVCGRKGELNSFYGQTHPDSVREKISQAKKGKANLKKRKLSAQDIEQIYLLNSEGVSKSDLAKQFAVSKPTISRCFKLREE